MTTKDCQDRNQHENNPLCTEMHWIKVLDDIYNGKLQSPRMREISRNAKSVLWKCFSVIALLFVLMVVATASVKICKPVFHAFYESLRDTTSFLKETEDLNDHPTAIISGREFDFNAPSFIMGGEDNVVTSDGFRSVMLGEDTVVEDPNCGFIGAGICK